MKDNMSEERPNLQISLGKEAQIEQACENRDVSELRSLARSSGGLAHDRHRIKAWPILLGSDRGAPDTAGKWRDLERHRDEDQVKLDVDRSFVYYPEDDSEKKRQNRRQDLSDAITGVLRLHPILHYFQGYHDIIQVLLLVLGTNDTIAAASRLSLLRIRDYMLPTMTATEFHLRLLPSILSAADPEVCAHLSHTQPFFALAATLTLYAHDIEEYGDIARLFDFLLASEAVVTLYLFAVVVVSRRDELLDIPSDEPEMLHSILSKLPKPLDLEKLIQSTIKLFEDHPPERLPGWAWSRIPSCSTLKTTRDFAALQKQTLKDGETFFQQEAVEIKRREVLQKRQVQLQGLLRMYRRPATWTGAALLVAFAALYLRESNTSYLMLGHNKLWAEVRQIAQGIWQRFSALS